jgi:chromosome segregation ATPase
MRKVVCAVAVTAAVLLASPARTWTQQNDQPASQSQASSQAQPAPATQQDSLAEAARKAREQKKEAPKSAKTFTNDNLPTEGGISTVGQSAGATSTATSSTASTAAAGKSAEAETPKSEAEWRERFQKLHHKLEQDQANLEVMQRELAQLNLQFYSDPDKGMQQELTRSDINNKTSDIDKMQAQIDADKQAISDAEDELRKSGGDPGWAR